MQWSWFPVFNLRLSGKRTMESSETPIPSAQDSQFEWEFELWSVRALEYTPVTDLNRSLAEQN
jgi:hypothetical protein